MRTLFHILLVLLMGVSAAHRVAAQIHTDFKAKNFPPSQKLEFTKAFNAYKEGERQYKLLIKDGNADLIPTAMANFHTAYAFNPNHIALNRYMATLLFMQNKNAEVFPYLEKLYDLKAELSSDELFKLASLLQAKGSFTRAELIFKRFLQLHGNGDFWAEGRLQNAEKRIAECEAGAEVGKQAVHFSVGTSFVKPVSDETRQLLYNHYYGWWALYESGEPERLSYTPRKTLPSTSTPGNLYTDLNGLVFLACNDSLITQVSGRHLLEVDKLNNGSHNRSPFLSANLRLLYFSSDRSGGFGGYDIWMARFDMDGKLVSVTNAGEAVNDQYDQLAPTLSADGTRFFMASNGKGTTGGFDILYGPNRGDSVENVKNLGFPVNSGYDETEVLWDITGTKGFVKRTTFDTIVYQPIHETGSAREALFIGTGFSSANIGPLSSIKYESGVSESFISGICKLSIQIRRTENSAAEIEIFNLADGSTYLRDRISDTATTLAYLLPSQNDYGVHINGEGLVPFTENLHLKTSEIFSTRELEVTLNPIKKGASFVLHNIFFSKDYSVMDASSEFEIGRIAGWLKQHPKVKVEVAVHTDSLSMHSVVIAAGESAAFQIYELLKQTYGIEKRRLDWMFYGPDKPIYVGKNMTETAKNRRIELIITDK